MEAEPELERAVGVGGLFISVFRKHLSRGERETGWRWRDGVWEKWRLGLIRGGFWKKSLQGTVEMANF